MKFKKNGGFTLVELIVVIAILAILAGVAVPAYSGYIAKANEAADLQLLGSLNTAFGAATMENGLSLEDMEGAEFVLTGNEGAKTISGLKLPGNVTATLSTSFTADVAQAVLNSFEKFYGDNMTVPFKVFVQIVFVDGAFAGVTADEDALTITTTSGVSVTISKADAEKFTGSAFGTDMTSEELLGKVDYVTNLASQMMADEGSALGELFASDQYVMAFANALGIELDPTDPDSVAAFVAAGQALALEKAQKDNPGVEVQLGDEYYQAAYNQIVANNAVLYAAQNSDAAAGDILDVLKGSNSKATIALNLLNEENNGVGLSQAAMAYGLYTAYAERTGATVPSSPTDVLSLLDSDTEFKAYINGEKTENNDFTGGQAASDLEGYLAAMSMINDNAQGDIVENVLVNGFNSADLKELLDSAKN